MAKVNLSSHPISRRPKVVRLQIAHMVRQAILPIGQYSLSKGGAVFLLTSFIFGSLVLATAWQQVSGINSVYKSERNLVAQQMISPPRGLFYDRNGQRLVTNKSSYGIVIKRSDYNAEKLQGFLTQLATKIDNLDIAETLQKFDASPDTHMLLIGGLDNNQRLLIEEDFAEYEFEMVDFPVREYLLGQHFSQLLGYTGIASLQDVKQGANSRDVVGKYRLEKILNTTLTGIRGRQISDANGVTTYPEVPGNNVVLTIDARWQTKLYDILGSQIERLGGIGGSVVIVDIANGNVISQVSYPSFDANLFSKGITTSEYQTLLNDPRTPLVDKSASTQLAPGSSFKLITAYALLENGIIDKDTRVFSTGCMQISEGFPFCEFGKYYLGDLSLVRALTRSSNIFFCTHIINLEKQLGFNKFVDSAKALGIGQLTGSGLDNEVAGVLASPDYKQQTFKQGWFLGDACNAVIGQGFTVVTPLQMAMAVSTLANGGKYYKPNYVLRVESQTGEVLKSDFSELVRTIPMKPETQALIMEGMRSVVASPEGTAYWQLHSMPGNFTAKSGSAQAFVNENGKWVDKQNGWIVGTFDYKGNRYAYAADISLAGGGWNVGQVMRRFANCLFSDFSVGCENV